MKSKIIEQMVAADPTMSKAAADRAIHAVFDATEAVVTRDGKAMVPGFGTFKKTHRAGRTGRNPQTGEQLTIAPRDVITFKPSKAS